MWYARTLGLLVVAGAALAACGTADDEPPAPAEAADPAFEPLPPDDTTTVRPVAPGDAPSLQP